MWYISWQNFIGLLPLLLEVLGSMCIVIICLPVYLFIYLFICLFLNYDLAAPRLTLSHYWRDSLTHPMLITAFLHIRPKGNQDPCNEVGSLSPAERLVGFELGIFCFWLQLVNPLDCSPQNSWRHEFLN